MVMTSPTKDTVCALIVTYHPDMDFAIRIQHVIEQVAAVVIVDNNSNAQALDMLQSCVAEHTNVILVRNAENYGVAAALNQGIAQIEQRGFTWAYLLDQDTTVLPRAIDTLGKLFNAYPHTEQLGVLCSNFIERGLGHAAYSPPEPDPASDEPSRWKEMMVTITAGSLIPLSVFQRRGGFREEYFIDHVDHEFCLRLRRHDLQIIMTYDPLIEHAIGNTKARWIKGHTFLTYNHSPIRYYYQTRNLITLTREYQKDFPEFFRSLWWSYRRTIAAILLFEDYKIQKLWCITRGFIDGFIKRMGR